MVTRIPKVLYDCIIAIGLAKLYQNDQIKWQIGKKILEKFHPEVRRTFFLTSVQEKATERSLFRH